MMKFVWLLLPIVLGLLLEFWNIVNLFFLEFMSECELIKNFIGQCTFEAR